MTSSKLNRFSVLFACLFSPWILFFSRFFLYVLKKGIRQKNFAIEFRGLISKLSLGLVKRIFHFDKTAISLSLPCFTSFLSACVTAILTLLIKRGIWFFANWAFLFQTLTPRVTSRCLKHCLKAFSQYTLCR